MSDDSRLAKIQEKLDVILQIVLRIEKEHGAKLQALIDGQKELMADFAEMNADHVTNHS